MSFSIKNTFQGVGYFFRRCFDLVMRWFFGDKKAINKIDCGTSVISKLATPSLMSESGYGSQEEISSSIESASENLPSDNFSLLFTSLHQGRNYTEELCKCLDNKYLQYYKGVLVNFSKENISEIHFFYDKLDVLHEKYNKLYEEYKSYMQILNNAKYLECLCRIIQYIVNAKHQINTTIKSSSSSESSGLFISLSYAGLPYAYVIVRVRAILRDLHNFFLKENTELYEYINSQVRASYKASGIVT